MNDVVQNENAETEKVSAEETSKKVSKRKTSKTSKTAKSAKKKTAKTSAKKSQKKSDMENLVKIARGKKRKKSSKRTAVDSARTEVGLSITDLAQILGIPYRSMQDYCRGVAHLTQWQERLIIKAISDYSEGKIQVPEPTPIYQGYFRKNPHQIEEEVYPMLNYFEKFIGNVYSGNTPEKLLNAYVKFLKKFFPAKAKILLESAE